MVRSRLRRGLAAAFFVCLLVASGPPVLAAGPPADSIGLWTRLFEAIESLFAVSEPAPDSPEHFYAPLGSELGPDNTEPLSGQTDSPTDDPELGQTIDPDG